MQNIHECTLRVCYVRALAEKLYTIAEKHENNTAVYGPSYATPHAAGLDLRACIDEKVIALSAGARLLVPTGIAVQAMQENLTGFIYSRSGLGAKQGLVVAQGVGVIDNDYRGELMVMLLNTSPQNILITQGQRIAQLVYQYTVRMLVNNCDTLDATKRGIGGFGHTGNV